MEKTESFMSRVQFEQNSGCWLWDGPDTGAKIAYGIFSYKQKREVAHRFSYRAFNGEIPSGLIVRHKCDVSFCVNPTHLEVGTHRDNAADMKARGREKKALGEAHGCSKLTNEEASKIRSLRGVTRRSMSQLFGVTERTIQKIRNNKARKRT